MSGQPQVEAQRRAAVVEHVRMLARKYEGINPSLITRYLGEGNEHYVVGYKAFKGDNDSQPTCGWVLKVPKVQERKLKDWETPEQVEKGYERLRHYFGDEAIPETHVFSSNIEGHDYSMLQREIPGSRHVTVEMLLTNPMLRKQFYDIIGANFRMYQETGEYLPLLGREGAISLIPGADRKPMLTNIVVEGEGENAKIRIVDFGRLTDNPSSHHRLRRLKRARHQLLDPILAKSHLFLKQHLPSHLESFLESISHEEQITFEHLENFLATHAESYALAARDGVCIISNEIAIELFFLHLLDKHMQGKEKQPDTLLRRIARR